MQESKSAFKALVDEMRNDVLELLSLLDREEALSGTVRFLLNISFFRLEISVHAHEAGHSTHVLVSEGLKVLEDAKTGGFGAHIEEDAYLWVKLSAEAFEKPQVRAEFSAVGVFEAADDFQFVGVVGIWAPQVLVDEGEVFLDGWWEVAVVLYKIGHSLPLKVFHLIENDVDALIEIALLLPLPSVQLSVEFHH